MIQECMGAKEMSCERMHLCPGLTLIRCTPNFDIQHKVSLKSKHLLPIFNNKVRVKVSVIFSFG